ncbi:MAG: sensor histidine kinase [Myxococcaceae bacterium]
MSTPPVADASSSLRRPQIFVVDDSKTIRVQLQQMLKTEFDCRTFADGPSALEAALAGPPDLIVSDVVMEPYDGYELCRRVRAEQSLADVPLVLLTSSEDRNGRAMGLEQGADDYLPKPVHERELFARVRSLLRLREAQQKIILQQQTLAASNEQLMKTQQELVAAEKMATLGSLAAGFAHEVNNPLAFVISGVKQLAEAVDEIADRKLDESGRQQVLQDVSEIKNEVMTGLNRIRALVKDLGRLSAEQSDQAKTLDVADEVDGALVALGPKLLKVQIRQEMQHKAEVHGPPGLISQIAQNLIQNAADAVAGRPSPTLTVRTRDVEGGVEVSVEDNGAGMADDVKARLFEPFFTTKPAGTAKGLGLSVCQSLAQRLGSNISYTTEEGVGTKFRFFVPLRAPDPAGLFNRPGRLRSA